MAEKGDWWRKEIGSYLWKRGIRGDRRLVEKGDLWRKKMGRYLIGGNWWRWVEMGGERRLVEICGDWWRKEIGRERGLVEKGDW